MSLETAAGAVLVVAPGAFAHDRETAEDNPFQRGTEPGDVERASAEWGRLVEALRCRGVRVAVRPAVPGCPSGVFPNNWFSTHADGTLVLYPMRSPTRRRERDPATVAWLQRAWPSMVDLSPFELEGEFLEGTGSLVLDRALRVAFAVRSPRTHERMVELWCDQFGYQPVVFDAVSPTGQPVYHTNVVLGLGSNWAVFCRDAVPEGQARLVERILRGTGRAVVPATWTQTERMACNVLELASGDVRFAVVGKRAWESLEPGQRAVVEREGGALVVDVSTVERVGGGGVRCMLAELFLPEGSELPA
jgi:hypothetical protein